MALTTVNGTFTEAGGDPKSGFVLFKLYTWSVSGGAYFVSAQDGVKVYLDASGGCAAQLEPTDAMIPANVYKVTLKSRVSGTWKYEDYGFMDVPSGGPYNLHDLIGATEQQLPATNKAAADSAAEAAAIAQQFGDVATAVSQAEASAAEAALYDGPRVEDVAKLLADTTLTYTPGQPGTVAAGDYVWAGEFLFKVADSAATIVSPANRTGYHVANSNATPVKFFAQAGSNGFRSYAAFGAVCDGVSDDTAAIIAAHSVGGRLCGGESKTYKISGTVSILAGTTLDLRGCSVKPTDALTGAAFTATGQDDITAYWGTIEGTGTAFSTGNENFIMFDTCANLKSYGGFFTKSRNRAISLRGCTRAYISDPITVACYGTGLEDRDGIDNYWSNPQSTGNGNTGVATYSGGRGMLVWRGTDITVMGGASKGCSEYGLRVYSQTGDATGSSEIKIIGHHCEDNEKIDFYAYNESGMVSTVTFSDCSVTRNTDPASKPIALQGANISWIGGSVRKTGTRAAVATFNLFDLSASKISGVNLVNQGTMIAWSGSSICSDIDISNNIADISNCGLVVGTNITYRGNKFIHGGAGGTDIAIDCGSSAEIIVDENEFDGFWRIISLSAQAITVRNNTSRNTTDLSFRVYGDAVAGFTSSGNDWDKGSNPTWFATAYRQKSPDSRITVYGGSAPTTLTWARGDRVVQSNPTVALPKSWVCTASGTPGTWVSEGDL